MAITKGADGRLQFRAKTRAEDEAGRAAKSLPQWARNYWVSSTAERRESDGWFVPAVYLSHIPLTRTTQNGMRDISAMFAKKGVVIRWRWRFRSAPEAQYFTETHKLSEPYAEGAWWTTEGILT